MTRTRTVDIVAEIVNELLFTIPILSVTDLTGGLYEITTCATYHLQPEYTIEIDEVEYQIISVQENESIIISGSVLPTATSFVAYAPFFFHGTPVKVSEELVEIPMNTEKTPMAYMSEELKEKYFGKQSAIDREVPIKIYFLTQSAEGGWTTDQYHTNAIDPMRNLANEFVEKCRSNRKIARGRFIEYTIDTRQRVALQQGGKKGNFAGAFLSGVELNLTLQINREPCVPCVIVVQPAGFTWEDMTDTWETYTATWETYQ